LRLAFVSQSDFQSGQAGSGGGVVQAGATAATTGPTAAATTGATGGAGGGQTPAIAAAADAPASSGAGGGAVTPGAGGTVTPGAGGTVTPGGGAAVTPGDGAAVTPSGAAIPSGTATPGAGVTPVGASDAVTPGAAGGTAAPGAGGGAPAAPAGSGLFKAATPREPQVGRHTVKFLPTVQPQPGSPLYGQGAGGAQAGGGVVEQSQLAQPGGGMVEQQQPSQGVGGVIDQATPGGGAGGISGGPISVSSSHLTSGQAIFAAKVAQLTGLSPRVIAAWELAEESGSAAQGRQAQNNFDWLNIGYTDSANFGTGDSVWGDPVRAAEATAGWIKGQDTIPGYGTASPGIQAILKTVGQSPQQQMMAIANSGWASSHYNNGQNLLATYEELSDIQIVES
jgi:hypothetical protein